ncbi:hypothetical protein D3C73_956270 [compost metagenome]
MAVADQVSFHAKDAAAAAGSQPQGFDTELHAQRAPAVEEGVADAVGGLKLRQHIHPYQIAAPAL